MKIKASTIKYFILLLPFNMPGVVQLMDSLVYINTYRNIGKIISMAIILAIAINNIIRKKVYPSKIWWVILTYQIIVIFSTLINGVDLNKAFEVGVQIIVATYLVDNALIRNEDSSIINSLHFIFSVYMVIDLIVMVINPDLVGIDLLHVL